MKWTAAAAPLLLAGCLLLPAAARAQTSGNPAPVEADFVTHDFRFASGESLAELRIHYRTFGKPRTDARGVTRNAVLILHGTGGNGGSLVRPEFAGELFGPGQPLDAARYFIVLPDGIGHGRSSKPRPISPSGPWPARRRDIQLRVVMLTETGTRRRARPELDLRRGPATSRLPGRATAAAGPAANSSSPARPR